jgi:predicted transcriptional regulator
MSTTIRLKLDETTRARLQRLGDTRDRSPHWLMKTAIREYLEREERIEQERLDDVQRWQRWVETGAHIDHDDMAAWLDKLAARADQAAEQSQASSPETAHDREQRNAAVADELGEWR